MRVGIVAGGAGSRLGSAAGRRPKPLVEVGGKPILWHIMRHYAHFGLREFVIAIGYRAAGFRRFMRESFPARAREATPRGLRLLGAEADEPDRGRGGDGGAWQVRLVDTGPSTETGGRIKRLAPYLRDGTFMLTWGDGVSDLDLRRLYDFHRAHGKLATLTAVHPKARFGHLEIDGNRVVSFTEKPALGDIWVNGAFFVLEPGVFDYIDGDATPWEREPLERLAAAGELMAYRHSGFWQCMDLPKERWLLDELWRSGRAPWRIWDRPELARIGGKP